MKKLLLLSLLSGAIFASNIESANDSQILGNIKKIKFNVLPMFSPFLEKEKWIEEQEVSVEKVSKIIKTGMPINSQDSKGNTLLHYVAHYGSLGGMMEFLICLGARGDIRNNEGRTAGDYDSRSRTAAIKELLLNSRIGIDPNRVDKPM